jgi:predicted ATPase
VVKKKKTKTEIPGYTSVSLKNFRCFQNNQNIPLAPLTFLVGPNSSGKSSIFDAILLLNQSRFVPTYPLGQQPRWIGPLVDIGSFNDTVYQHNSKLPIEIGVEYLFPTFRMRGIRGLSNSRIGFSHILRANKNDPIGTLAGMTITECKSNESVRFKYSKVAVTIDLLGTAIDLKHKSFRETYGREDDFFYEFHDSTSDIEKTINNIFRENLPKLRHHKAALKRLQFAVLYPYFLDIKNQVERVSSGRSAPRRWYSIAEMAGVSRQLITGARVFNEVEPQMLAESSPQRKRKKDISFSLNNYLSKLDIATNIEHAPVSAYHSMINVTDNITGVKSNLIDVGYGASQVIPILSACMSKGQGTLFVEQPEIHIHPKSQSNLAEILCETSFNRQVIIETHSEHMINRARILVAEGRMDPHHVIINFVARSSKGSKVKSIRILKNGDFDVAWPPGYGFFDERYQDTLRIMDLKQQQMGK